MLDKNHKNQYMREYYKRPKVKEHRKEYLKEYQQRPEVRARIRAYNQKPEVKEKRRKYLLEHPEPKEKQKKRGRAYYERNREKVIAQAAVYQKKHPDKHKESMKKTDMKIRIKVFSHYSNGIIKCSCCGENHIEFLSVNHIKGGGNKHRKQLKMSGGIKFYRWLIKNNYPEGYNVLCHNCNQAIGYFRYCPHQKERELSKGRNAARVISDGMES